MLDTVDSCPHDPGFPSSSRSGKDFLSGDERWSMGRTSERPSVLTGGDPFALEIDQLLKSKDHDVWRLLIQ